MISVPEMLFPFHLQQILNACVKVNRGHKLIAVIICVLGVGSMVITLKTLTFIQMLPDIG